MGCSVSVLHPVVIERTDGWVFSVTPPTVSKTHHVSAITLRAFHTSEPRRMYTTPLASNELDVWSDVTRLSKMTIRCSTVHEHVTLVHSPPPPAEDGADHAAPSSSYEEKTLYRLPTAVALPHAIRVMQHLDERSMSNGVSCQ